MGRTEDQAVDPAFEKQFSPQELAKLWDFDPTTIQRWFRDEPGVLCHGDDNYRRGKRQHITIRIPASVASRVYHRKVKR